MDAWIAEYNISRKGFDITPENTYLLSLSADAADVYLDALEKDVVRTELADEMLSYYFEDLEKYEDLGIRKFNLSRYLGAQAAREYGERTF